MYTALAEEVPVKVVYKPGEFKAFDNTSINYANMKKHMNGEDVS